jgi:hypothetical protein
MSNRDFTCEHNSMKKIGNRKIGLLSIILVAVLVGSVAVFYSGGSGGIARFIVYGAGTPDSYDSRIFAFAIMQNATGSWTDVTNVAYGTYTPGYSLSVPANQKTIIRVSVHLNLTLAPDLATASSRARVYLTIAGVVSSSLMVYGSGYNDGVGHWFLNYYYPATPTNPTSVWIPATDTTYATTAQYQAYY